MEGVRMLNISFASCQPNPPAADFPRPCPREQEELLKPFRAAAVGPWTLFDLRGLREPLRRNQFSVAQSRPNSREDAETMLITYARWHVVMRMDVVLLLQNSERSHLPSN